MAIACTYRVRKLNWNENEKRAKVKIKQNETEKCSRQADFNSQSTIQILSSSLSACLQSNSLYIFEALASKYMAPLRMPSALHTSYCLPLPSLSLPLQPPPHIIFSFIHSFNFYYSFKRLINYPLYVFLSFCADVFFLTTVDEVNTQQ